MKNYFCGIYGIHVVGHGEWADPEIIWHGKSFNYYDVVDALSEDYEETTETPTMFDFEIWAKKNASLVRETLLSLI
jgi:hypothetical protein